MKKSILILAILGTMGVISCSSDDDGNVNSEDNCVICIAYNLQGTSFPEMEICKGENGNAFIEGQDTTVSYSVYVSALESYTTCN